MFLRVSFLGVQFGLVIHKVLDHCSYFVYVIGPSLKLNDDDNDIDLKLGEHQFFRRPGEERRGYTWDDSDVILSSVATAAMYKLA